jgi:DNA modification methylase
MIRIIQGDVREQLPLLPDDSFDCIVTSPPYFRLRDYGCIGQIGVESTLDEYLHAIVPVCRELRRVLKPSGVFFLNIGDSYAGSRGAQSSGIKPKDLYLIPERLGILLQQDGWWVRSRIVWHKLNVMPDGVTDRPTNAHETIWMLTKDERYFWDADAVREPYQKGLAQAVWRGSSDSGKWADGGPDRQTLASSRTCNPDGRNMRNVWAMGTEPFPEAHFAPFPPKLAERCIKAACPIGGHVLDPFAGSGTTGLVADRLGRDCTLIDLNTKYTEMALNRIKDDAPLLYWGSCVHARAAPKELFMFGETAT